MQARTCPNCGLVRYSADTFFPWTCESCGATVPVPTAPTPRLCKLKHMFVCQPEECGRADECGEKKYVLGVK